LDDGFEGDEVAVLAVRGRKVDPNFRRNYAWAKHAIDRGALKKVVVVVALDRDSWVHTVSAVTSALSGAKLHQGARFKVDAEIADIGGEKLTKVLEALKELEPRSSVTFGNFTVNNVNANEVARTQKTQAKASEPKAETKNDENSNVEKVGAA
jgi:hypothetical protein